MTPSMSIIIAVMTVLSNAYTLDFEKTDHADRQEVYCGAQNVYFESRGEPGLGMVAVSQVVLNRVKDKRWPDTICDVVWQHKQFSWTHDGKSDRIPLGGTYQKRLWMKSVYMFLIAHTEKDVTNGATHYHSVGVDPWWAKHMAVTAIIGNHKFLKEM